MAIIEAGISLEMTITRGVDQELFNVLDTGRLRTGADLLALNGYKNHHRLSAVCQFLMNFYSGKIATAASNRGRTSGKHKITKDQILEYANNHPEMVDWIGECQEYYDSFRYIGSGLTFGMYCILKRQHPRLTEQFFEKLFFGIELKRGDSCQLFRTKIMNDRLNNKRITAIAKMGYFIKTWNAFREDKKLTYLRFDVQREQFPEIK